MNQDGLSDILHWLRLKAEVYLHTDFQGCWAVDTSGSRHVPFHFVNNGNSWLHLPDAPPRELHQGDLVIFPRDCKHMLSSEQNCPSRYLVDETLEKIGKFPDEGPLTGLTCGFFEFENKAAWPLLDSLPEVIVLELSQPDKLHSTRTLLELLISELEANEPGTRVSVNYLTHTLFVHILRSQIGNGLEKGLLSALFHPKIGKALGLIHGEPARDWSVENLAHTIGMSRSGFAEQFRDLTTKTPMRYLAEWRMLQASELLRTSELSITDIAERCGYHSEVAFRKAFKSITGATPGAIRKQT